MPLTVTPDQFELRGGSLVHKPTGAQFLMSGDGAVPFAWGTASEPSADGLRYDTAEIQRVAGEIAQTEHKSCL